MDRDKESDLLQEWREILAAQAAIVLERRKSDEFAGLVGALVAGDDLAREYQRLNRRKWAIKMALFPEHYIGA